MPRSEDRTEHTSRRRFLASSLSCAGHVALMASAFPPTVRRLWAERRQGDLVAEEAFGRLERIGDGLFALVSKPLESRTTLCNGGLIAGDDGVLAVEGFYSADGAAWLAERSRELTGRRPTHVVVTHYHADHSHGLHGYFQHDPGPACHATAVTRDLVRDEIDAAEAPALDRRWADVVLLKTLEPTSFDLGGRRVRIVPRAGHTASDVTLELDEPSLVYCGDLVWNGMFPNYMDARPSRLSAAVRDLSRGPGTVYVPGHGPVASHAELERYLAVIDDVEAAARSAHERGLTAAQAAADYAIPPALGDWTLFNPAYIERAIDAWLAELAG